jgi:hypothetical protein
MQFLHETREKIAEVVVVMFRWEVFFEELLNVSFQRHFLLDCTVHVFRANLILIYIGRRFDSRQKQKDFSSSLCVQTFSGAHPASCTMDTGVLSPGVKRGRDVSLTSHPHLMPTSKMNRSYTPPPQETPWCAVGLLYFI